MLSDRQKAVIETIRMRLTEKQRLAYLKEVGFEMSDHRLVIEKRIRWRVLKLKGFFILQR